MSEVAARLSQIRERIADAAHRVGRDPSEVTVIGACKRQPIERVQEAIESGLSDLGENRIQEAEQRQPLIGREVRWHLIGPLQSNKARRAERLFDVVQTIDRVKIAHRLNWLAEESGRTLPVFLEVNVGAEPAKHGFLVEEIAAAAAEFPQWQRLSLQGLMAIPPFASQPDESRRWFRALRRLRDEIFASNELCDSPGLLSMGMSGDFDVAVEEGATHVRVGTALFGARS